MKKPACFQAGPLGMGAGIENQAGSLQLDEVAMGAHIDAAGETVKGHVGGVEAKGGDEGIGREGNGKRSRKNART